MEEKADTSDTDTKIKVENNRRPQSNSRPRSLLIRILKRIVYIVKLTVVFIVALILLPVLLLLLSPLYVFRYIIFKTSKMIGPTDLGKMMSSRSSIIGVDTIYKNPQCVLVGKMVCDGKLDYDQFLADIQTTWIDAKGDDGSIKYPELSQYVTRWLGLYLFWKNETNFQLTDHVKVYKRPPLIPSDNTGEVEVKSDDKVTVTSQFTLQEIVEYETDESVNELMAQFVSKTFDSHKSPWEIQLVQNYMANDQNKTENKLERTVLMIRWHHSVMDGLSTFKLLSQFTTLGMESVPKPRSSQKKTIWSTLSFIYRVPYEAIVASVESLDQNPWHLSESKLTRNSYFRLSNKIPVEKLHEIKTNYQVSFSTVIFAALTGTLRNFMQKSKPNEKIPKIIHAGLPFPYPGGGHPAKLRNHMSLCTAKLPVGIEDPIERLYWIEDHLNDLRNSTIPFMSFHIMPFLGSLPIPLLKMLVKNDNTTCMFSHMPGPTKTFQNLHGQTFTEWCFTSGHGPGSVGISVFCLSYGGNLIFSTVVDDALVSDPSLAKGLSEGVVAEINQLVNLY